MLAEPGRGEIYRAGGITALRRLGRQPPADVAPEEPALLVRDREPRVPRPRHLPLDGVAADRLPAHGAFAAGAPTDVRVAAGPEQLAGLQALADGVAKGFFLGGDAPSRQAERAIEAPTTDCDAVASGGEELPVTEDERVRCSDHHGHHDTPGLCLVPPLGGMRATDRSKLPGAQAGLRVSQSPHA